MVSKCKHCGWPFFISTFPQVLTLSPTPQHVRYHNPSQPVNIILLIKSSLVLINTQLVTYVIRFQASHRTIHPDQALFVPHRFSPFCLFFKLPLSEILCIHCDLFINGIRQRAVLLNSLVLHALYNQYFHLSYAVLFCCCPGFLEWWTVSQFIPVVLILTAIRTCHWKFSVSLSIMYPCVPEQVLDPCSAENFHNFCVRLLLTD